jgi:hypothetical protein
MVLDGVQEVFEKVSQKNKLLIIQSFFDELILYTSFISIK